MRVILKSGVIVMLVENEAERDVFSAWRESKQGHVFSFDGGSPEGGVFHDLGPRETAYRVPINLLFDQNDCWQPISNLAETPFTLRGRAFASVEGFWQGLKFEDEEERRRVATLWGKEAKRAAAGQPQRETFHYDGADYYKGGPRHHAPMREACTAKFQQSLMAREALLATGDRLLTHRVRRDSTTIPGVLMAEIWMRIRDSLATSTRPSR